MHIVNELRKCAVKLVNEISLYYDARSKKHQKLGMKSEVAAVTTLR